MPIGLGNDAHSKTLSLQHSTNDSHAKARMIYISIARDQDDVTAVPTQLGHFGTAHGQKGGRAKARRPKLAIAVQGLGVAREKGDVNQSVHGPNWDNPVV